MALRHSFRFRLGATAILALALSRAGADGTEQPRTAVWPGDFVGRVEILALLETLHADLLTHDSATLTLEHWCAAHHLATPAVVTANRVTEAKKAPSPEQRQDLRVGAMERIGYRHVKLSCGAVLLSEADNWYVPARLTPQMNRTLESTDTPFGKVVLPLDFRRHTLSSKMLWSPLSEHWEMHPVANSGQAEPLRIPENLLQNTAMLSLPDGTPISEVVETYKSGLLAFPAPH